MEEGVIKPITNQGFFSYVFKLSRFKQEDLMNIVQYLMLAVVPVMLFIYFTKKYFPSVSDDYSSMYIFIITFIELIFMIIGIFFIDRMINYIPTYSGKYYETINLTTVILVFMIFMFLTTGGFKKRAYTLLHRFDDWFTIDDMIVRKLGYTPRPFDFDTVDDLFDSSVHAKNAKGNKKKPANGAKDTGKEQMSQQYATPPPLPTQGPIMPNNGGGVMPTQQVQNFNSMYTNPAASMTGGGGGGGGSAAQGMDGGDDSFMEPMAANAALGGGCGSWSSW